jgi:hypothetical protein
MKNQFLKPQVRHEINLEWWMGVWSDNKASLNRSKFFDLSTPNLVFRNEVIELYTRFKQTTCAAVHS